MTETGLPVQPRRSSIVERVPPLKLSVQNCLEGVGISLLSEWDVLNFMRRHRVSLMSADQIARLIGYESTVVRGALDRLQREKLVERSRVSQGVRFYRILASTDARRGHCLQQLIGLSESRSGRLQLTKQLKQVRAKSGLEEPSAKSKR
jgi:DNA-binding MarR family transcriptional regulator